MASLRCKALLAWLLSFLSSVACLDSSSGDETCAASGECNGADPATVAGNNVTLQLLEAAGCADVECLIGRAFRGEDQQALYASTGDPTEIYGEVAVPGMHALLDLFEWGPNASFYDLGCGSGRLVLFAALTRDLGRSRGIERVSRRLQLASDALATLEGLTTTAVSWRARPEFHDADFRDVSMADATAIYMASVYFPDELMMMLAHRFLELREGARIASLVNFPFDRHGKRKLAPDSPLQALRIINRVSIPMSWSDDGGMNVYVYELNRRAAAKELLKPLPASAGIAEALALLKDVVEPADDAVWGGDVSVAIQRLASLRVAATDELAVLSAGGAPSVLALRVALAVLSTPAPRVAAIVDANAPQEKAAVEDIVAALKKFAPGHMPWHRRVTIDLEIPKGIVALEAGGASGMSKQLQALEPGTAVAGYEGCLPGCSPGVLIADGGCSSGAAVADSAAVMVIAPTEKSVTEEALASLDAMGDAVLGLTQLKTYMSDRSRWARFAALSGSTGSGLRIPASDVAAWMRAAQRCH